MKIYEVILPPRLPFFGFVAALLWLQRDRAALLHQGLPTAGVEEAIASTSIGVAISLAAAALITAAVAFALKRFGDGPEDTPEFGLAA
jgi:hypothetical protein